MVMDIVGTAGLSAFALMPREMWWESTKASANRQYTGVFGP